MSERTGTTYALTVLFAINTMNFFDRQIGGALAEPIRREWALSDSALGALGTAFTLLYALVGIPLGRLSDRKPRKAILSIAVLLWSALTSLSALTRNFGQMFATRLGVGVGEAACAPAATSLIGDLVPPGRRARAMSIFMLGLPIGIALSYLVSSFVAQAWGWRAAFLIAGIPGVICAIAAMFIVEPQRGMQDAGAALGRSGPTESRPHVWRRLLSIPTLWWLIASGALHNFNMYALGSFLAPLLMRYHGATLRQAGMISMIVFGLAGAPGLIAGGALADRMSIRRRDGRLIVGGTAILISAPLLLLALSRPAHATIAFAVFAAAGCMAMYVYYSSVYATLHDVVEPSLRGTAMALYFFAMYVLGASFGPLVTGMVSDYFTRRAAAVAGVTDATRTALEPFRGAGLHSAMYLIPILSVALTFVLFAATRTVARDMERRG
ncbi:MAG TPA: MFS transporter [Thermoanaerobaculia bacterium]|nr:MFS transporter [Thermoanaerobaculia bacterium]